MSIKYLSLFVTPNSWYITVIVSKLLTRHYCDVMISAMASQITRVSVVCTTGCLGADQRKHQSYASLAFVKGIYCWPVNSPHKGTVTRKTFLSDDVIMETLYSSLFRVMYEVSFLSSHSDKCTVFVITALNGMSCCSEQHNNGSRLY